ncbi:MAG TPA: hypothetical protein VFY84_16645 [Jiangellales bacterium]|nr:hypothetical protein [Jiangellales bacterium]
MPPDTGAWRSMDILAGSRRVALDTAFPDFAARQDFTNVIIADLELAGLITASLGGTVSGRAVYDALASNLAKRFLAFIADQHRAS